LDGPKRGGHGGRGPWRRASQTSATGDLWIRKEEATDDPAIIPFIMLYELIGVVRPNRPINEIKEITRTTGSLVLAAGGVVRGITNWGTFLLPKPARKQGATYHQGHYFILRFDSSAKTQHAVRRTLGLDPRMIRYSVVKMGSKLEEGASITGQVQWPSQRGRSME
ncbi:hypothetical protein KC343_g14471, partial [Hortaea werneckii]